MGLPPGAVQNALTKAGLDPEIINMDPEKSYSSQIKQKGGDDEKDDDPPLKDDEKYTKYFKVSTLPSLIYCLLSQTYF